LAIQSPYAQQKRRVVDRNFVLFNLFQLGATIADVESTHFGLSRGLRETNPIFGERPSRFHQYLLAIPVSAAMAGLSYKQKKKAPHSRYWMIPPSVAGAVHFGATTNNLYRALR
jgi:hypothetical protein